MVMLMGLRLQKEKKLSPTTGKSENAVTTTRACLFSLRISARPNTDDYKPSNPKKRTRSMSTVSDRPILSTVDHEETPTPSVSAKPPNNPAPPAPKSATRQRRGGPRKTVVHETPGDGEDGAYADLSVSHVTDITSFQAPPLLPRRGRLTVVPRRTPNDRQHHHICQATIDATQEDLTVPAMDLRKHEPTAILMHMSCHNNRCSPRGISPTTSPTSDTCSPQTRLNRSK